jgi:hypothetical protein
MDRTHLQNLHSFYLTVWFGACNFGDNKKRLGACSEVWRAMIKALEREPVAQADRSAGDVLPHSVPIIVHCLFEKRQLGWQGFTLEYGLAVQGESLEDARRRLESVIICYINEALSGEDRPYAEVLLRRRATARVYFRYHLHRLLSNFRPSGGGPKDLITFPLPLKAGLCLSWLMSGHYPPLSADDFKAVLDALGFVKRPPKSGTSHEQWVATIDGVFRKVTVDPPKAPFSPDLISSMAKQAGFPKKRIYEIHFGRVSPQAPVIEPVPEVVPAKPKQSRFGKKGFKFFRR